MGTLRQLRYSRHMSQAHTQAILQRLVQALTARIPNLVAIYRFGSFGTGAQRPDSDIDLGLQPDARLDPVQLFHLAGELATEAGRDVDLVDMITCSTVMRAQIVATGTLIYCADRYRCEDFATTAYSRYAHLNEARRGILEDIQARGSIHD